MKPPKYPLEKHWIKQAENAIAQGQTLNEFVLHASHYHRPEAIRAYVIVRKRQGFVGNPADNKES